MSLNVDTRSWLLLLFLCYIKLSHCTIRSIGECQLWHFLRNGHCHCGITGQLVVNCDENFIYITQGSCITWDNVTNRAEVHRCLFSLNDCSYAMDKYQHYRIPTTDTGETLNYFTCGYYNRQGSYCSECIDGYGPAVFSDHASCADCSKHKYFWILNLMLQLFMVTILCLFLILFQIKGTSSPFNVIVMLAQLVTMGLKLSGGFYARLACSIGQTLTSIVVVSFGIFNLDFFYNVIPRFCISSSFKSINILLLDYVIAAYPLFLTVFLYVCIKISDRQYISLPSNCLKKYFKTFHNSWNPKKTIVNTFATFLLLSYSKFLFTSICLLVSFQSYNIYGKSASSSALLLFDPTIRFLHSEHIPYVVVALLVIVIIIILPPLLLLVYPTAAFKKCLTCLGFQRWDILHYVMDIFQGWYKDGTEDTRDYRYLSALYFLIRIALGCDLVAEILNYKHDGRFPDQLLILGTSSVFLGMAYFTLKPYKIKWMNHFDGWMFVLVGVLLLLDMINNKALYIIGAAVGVLTTVSLCTYAAYKKNRV